MVLQNWKNAGVIDDDLNTYDEWDKLINESRGYPVPDGTEWTPGYEDYNEIIAQLSAKGRGPKGVCANILRHNRKLTISIAKYLNRLARWPSEERKQRESMMQLPFWEQEIDLGLVRHSGELVL
jgi:hypothetical protein